MVGVAERPLYRVGLVSKGPCDGSKATVTFHIKTIQKAPKIPSKGRFLDMYKRL
jgi:hypothetical protein